MAKRLNRRQLLRMGALTGVGVLAAACTPIRRRHNPFHRHEPNHSHQHQHQHRHNRCRKVQLLLLWLTHPRPYPYNPSRQRLRPLLPTLQRWSRPWRVQPASF